MKTINLWHAGLVWSKVNAYFFRKEERNIFLILQWFSYLFNKHCTKPSDENFLNMTVPIWCQYSAVHSIDISL